MAQLIMSTLGIEPRTCPITRRRLYHEDGTLLVASLFPIELFINLTRELVNEDYTNATKEQLEWAIRTLLEERESDLKDYDVFPACDWLVRSSDLDPDARKVTITL